MTIVKQFGRIESRKDEGSTEEVEGYVDAVDGRVVFGWSWNGARPDDPVEVDVLVDGEVAGTCAADLYRADLVKAGKGNGRHAFEFLLPEAAADGREHVVAARERSTGTDLGSGPLRVRVERSDRATIEDLDFGDDTPWPQFPGRFGGLWIDLNNAESVLEGKTKLGWMSDTEAELMRRFMGDGYVVLEKAVPVESIDRLNSDISAIWHGNSSVRCFAQVHEPDGSQRVRPFAPELRNRASKILDLYGHLESARQVIFCEKLVRFISLVFERPLTAFQGLYFEYGSGQEIHKDTAFVKVDSPVEFVASWVALEDIEPGSGELEYYRGSHRLPEFLFNGDRKWMPPLCEKAGEYYRFLHDESQKRGLPRERFRASKGDVLIWHSELAHGGSRVEKPDRTRRSFVTHYCPANRKPVYPRASEVVQGQHSPMSYYCFPIRD